MPENEKTLDGGVADTEKLSDTEIPVDPDKTLVPERTQVGKLPAIEGLLDIEKAVDSDKPVNTEKTVFGISSGYLAKVVRLVPLASFSPGHQKEVLKNANLRTYLPGRFIFKQGSEDHFCFYLLEGELALIADGEVSSKIDQNSESSFYPLAQLVPRRYSALAQTEVTVLSVNKHLLDKVSILQSQKTGKKGQPESLQVVDLGKTQVEEDGEEDWMVRMLHSELFSKIPTANIHRLFSLMKPMQVKPRQVIVRQGEAGDHYYVIKKGRCAVLQKIALNKPLVKLAMLETGDSFGEESLLSKSRRNASVVAMMPGTLMCLLRRDFDELIKKPVLKSVLYKEAKKMVEEEKAVWLDVRFPSECRDSPLKKSLNMPIYLLRKKLSELKQDKKYIACCDNGERSSTATFLLAQNGFDVYHLKGGIQKIPS